MTPSQSDGAITDQFPDVQDVRKILSTFPPELDIQPNVSAPPRIWQCAFSGVLQPQSCASLEEKANSAFFIGCCTNVSIENLQKEVEHWKNMYLLACDELIRFKRTHFGIVPSKANNSELLIVNDCRSVNFQFPNAWASHIQNNENTSETLRIGNTTNASSSACDINRNRGFSVKSSSRYHVMSFPNQYNFKILLSAGATSFCSGVIKLPVIPRGKGGVGIVLLFQLENRKKYLKDGLSGTSATIETGRSFHWKKDIQVAIDFEAAIKEGNAASVKLQSMKPNNKDLISERYRQSRSFFVYESYRSDENKRPTVKTMIGIYKCRDELHLVFVKVQIDKH